MICVCLIEGAGDTDRVGDKDAQSLRDSILKSPSDDSSPYWHNRSDQGVYFDCSLINRQPITIISIFHEFTYALVYLYFYTLNCL